MTMSLYLFLDMYLHSGEYHVGTVGIDIRNYIFAVLMLRIYNLTKLERNSSQILLRCVKLTIQPETSYSGIGTDDIQPYQIR